MPYLLNPHQHVKIWLSKNRDLFLNQENQLRLVKTRVDNPKDVIYLVYAKELLSEKALQDLHTFCKKHEITPVCIEEQIIPACSDNEDEIRLIGLYRQEIAALNDGGNLAAASDILRWLKPIYSLGVYSDFDVKINTQGLPESISVDAPIILPIGTTPSYVSWDLEMVALNNDTIAIPGNDAEALRKIEAIQKYIYNAYQNNDGYRKFDERLKNELSELIGAESAARRTVRDTRYMARKLLSEGLGDPSANPIELRKRISAIEGEGRCINFISEQGDVIPISSQFLLIQSVVNTTGSFPIFMSLFEKCFIKTPEVKVTLSPYSLQNYNLQKAFISGQCIPLHASTHELEALAKKADSADNSWTPKGAAAVDDRLTKINKAAATLQAVFRSNQLRKERAKEREKVSPPFSKSDIGMRLAALKQNLIEANNFIKTTPDIVTREILKEAMKGRRAPDQMVNVLALLNLGNPGLITRENFERIANVSKNIDIDSLIKVLNILYTHEYLPLLTDTNLKCMLADTNYVKKMGDLLVIPPFLTDIKSRGLSHQS